VTRNGSSGPRFLGLSASGCQSYVGVEANEYQGSAIIGYLLDNNGNGIPPKTPEMFELDADLNGPSADQLNAGDVKVTCD
jgi:hypothetical protein